MVKWKSGAGTALLAYFAFIGAHLVNASETRTGTLNAGSAESQPVKVVRKGHVLGRTADHRARLDALGWEIFEPKIPSFEYRYFRVKSKELFTRFGEPVIRSTRKVRHRDPGPI